MNCPRINPNRLPGGSGAYFILICITSYMVSFWAGRSLPNPAYFVPSINWSALASQSIINGYGPSGVIVCIFLTGILFLSHSRRQRHAFGKTDELSSQDNLALLVGSIATEMGVRIDRIIVDRDITNADSLAFGFLGRRTILVGKRLRLMSVVAPTECKARMTHEIAHFKNGDVVYAFLSRALVQANLVLMFLVIAWIAIQPLAFVINNYLAWAYCPPKDPICPLFSGRNHFTDFLAVQWGRQLAYYKLALQTNLVSTGPTAMFWVLLLFLEHRSLLRVREVLADAQAAKLVGPKAIEDTLANGLKVNGSPVWDSLLFPFSAHPRLAERVRLISCPTEVAMPTSSRFLFLGLVYSMASQLLSAYNNSIINLDARFGTMFTLAAPHDLSSWSTVIWGAAIFAILPFPILAALLRLSMSSVVLGAPLSTSLLRILKAVVVVCLGVVLGDALLPYIEFGLSFLASGRPISTSILVQVTSVSRLLEVLQLAVALVLVACLYWAELRVIVRGTRSTSVPVLLWGVLMVATYYAVWIVFHAGYLAAANWSSLNGAQYLLIVLIAITMYFAITTLVVRMMKGTLVLSQSEKHLAPWLFEV
jgi:hypothetical protein